MVVHFQNFSAPESISPALSIPSATAASNPAFANPAFTGHSGISHSGETAPAATDGLYRRAGKRVLDILFVLLALPVALPLLAVMSLLVMRDGASPFYRQDRLGRGGQVFRLVKIRTMVPDAKARLDAHLASCPASRREWDESQKLKCDPRITRVGRILRKSSLDELPQLWNVLCGEMSIVGPRPMMVEQQTLYPGRAYYRLRPGITGPWQVSDRNNGTFAGRAKYDADYDADLSLATDLSILLRTVTVVVRGTGY